MSDASVPVTYGAISSSTPGEAEPLTGPQAQGLSDDASFDTRQTYYLKTNSQWTRRKVWATAVPILAACLVMGGIAFFLLRDFGHLYPGRGGDRSPFYGNGGMSSSTGGTGSSNSNELTSTPSSTSKSLSVPESEVVSRTSKSSSRDKNQQDAADTTDGASCSVHPDCSKLIGACCPTTDGRMLSCCNS